jgi:hypothetical protein
MIDRDSNDVETAAYLARADSYPDDRPDASEYADDAPKHAVVRDAQGWAIANRYREDHNA